MANEIIVVTPQGRLDAAGSRPLAQQLARHVAEGHAHLIVDLEDTRYVSSNGLRVLLAALKDARKHGGALKLCCLTPRLIEIFEMAGFDRVFEIYANREQAEKSFPGA
jgi:anti-anti-sigma factor